MEETKKESKNLYMCTSNCVLSTKEFNGSKIITESEIKSMIKLKFEGFITLDILSLFNHLKAFYRLDYLRAKLSFDDSNNLIMAFKDEINNTSLKVKLPLLTNSEQENIKDYTYKISIGFIIEQLKLYKVSELRQIKEIKLSFDFYDNHPIKFNCGFDHEFIIAPVVDND